MISAYHYGKAQSVIHLLNFQTGELWKTLLLKNIDGTNYTGHAGGLATNNDFLWVTDNYMVYSYSLEDVISQLDMTSIAPISSNKINIKADFSNFSNEVLWIGEYYYKFLYPTDKNNHLKIDKNVKNHALLYGYKIEENNISYNFDTPDYVISIPSMVQGVATTKNHFIISQSFWSFRNSNIRIYENFLEKEPSGTYTINDKKIPIWYLKESESITAIDLPPMSEGIEIINNELYILFESASNYYRYYTKNAIDNIIKINIPNLTKE